MMLMCLNTSDSISDHSVKVLPISFLHCKVSFPFVINKYLVRKFFESI